MFFLERKTIKTNTEESEEARRVEASLLFLGVQNRFAQTKSGASFQTIHYPFFPLKSRP